jgi:hypothetical protein
VHLEPLILQHLLDRDVRSFLRPTSELCLEHNAEGAVSDDFAVGVGDVSRFSGLSIRSDNFDDLPGVVDGCKTGGRDRRVRYGWLRCNFRACEEGEITRDGSTQAQKGVSDDDVGMIDGGKKRTRDLDTVYGGVSGHLKQS